MRRLHVNDKAKVFAMIRTWKFETMKAARSGWTHTGIACDAGTDVTKRQILIANDWEGGGGTR